MYINANFGKVGHKLRDIRKSYNWTLQNACDKVIEISKNLSKENPRFKEVKLNPSHLSKIENNEIDTSDYYIALLCEAYQIKISDLYKEESDDDKTTSSSLLHLPPHLREFVCEPENYYLINMAHNLKKFGPKETEIIREFFRLINI